MFGDLNRVDLIGNITQDLTVRYTGTGKPVLSFSVATNRRYKAPQDQEWKDEATFHNVVIWGDQAEGIAQRARKGTRVYISGRLQNRNWQDSEGKTNYKTEIIVEKIILLDRYEKGSIQDYSGDKFNQDTESAGKSKTASTGNQAPKNSKENKPAPQGDTTIDPDDLPF